MLLLIISRLKTVSSGIAMGEWILGFWFLNNTDGAWTGTGYGEHASCLFFFSAQLNWWNCLISLDFCSRKCIFFPIIFLCGYKNVRRHLSINICCIFHFILLIQFMSALQSRGTFSFQIGSRCYKMLISRVWATRRLYCSAFKSWGESFLTVEWLLNNSPCLIKLRVLYFSLSLWESWPNAKLSQI